MWGLFCLTRDSTYTIIKLRLLLFANKNTAIRKLKLKYYYYSALLIIWSVISHATLRIRLLALSSLELWKRGCDYFNCNFKPNYLTESTDR